jgi:hypothetical protein
MVFRKGYAVSFVLIVLIIAVSCVGFYLRYDNSQKDSVSLSPQDKDGLHLECVNVCGYVAGEQVCYPRCQYVFGEGPDLCDPIGSVCLMP